MDNYIDDNEAYQRLLPPCGCGCFRHCGLQCCTDGCDCNRCTCPECIDRVYEQGKIQIGPTDL